MQPAGRRDVVDLALQGGAVRASEAVSRSQALARLRLGDVAFRECGRGFTILSGPIDDLVIDIGEVLDEFNLITAELKISSDHIEYERAARMADMAVVIHRHTTDIHPDRLWLERLERLFFPGECVVDREHGLVTTPE